MVGDRPLTSDHERQFGSYGEHDRPTVRVAIRDGLVLGGLLRKGAPYKGKRIADIGCWYRAESSRRLRKDASSAVLSPSERTRAALAGFALPRVNTRSDPSSARRLADEIDLVGLHVDRPIVEVNVSPLEGSEFAEASPSTRPRGSSVGL